MMILATNIQSSPHHQSTLADDWAGSLAAATEHEAETVAKLPTVDVCAGPRNGIYTARIRSCSVNMTGHNRKMESVS